MNQTFVIPDEALPFILFQRTGYLKLTHSLLYRILRRISPVSLYKQAVHLDAKLRSTAIKKLYSDDMQNEYQTMKQVLPPTCSTVLDIGCGIAGINILLQRHYGTEVDFYLLDKTAMEDEIFYLFNDRGAFYNSLNLAANFLEMNGIEKNRIHTQEATDRNEIKVDRPIDLVISLISWGFHYPVTVYLDEVYRVLAPGGRMVIDVRRDTDGIADIRKKFSDVKIIEESHTRQRIVAVKP